MNTTKKQTGSIFAQIATILFLYTLILWSLDPVLRIILRDLAVVIGMFGVWHAIKLLK